MQLLFLPKKDHALQSKQQSCWWEAIPSLRDENPNAIESNIVQPKGSAVPNIAGAQLANEDVTVGPKFYKFLCSRYKMNSFSQYDCAWHV